jgi:hypothetical protein
MDVLCKYINEFTLSAVLLGSGAADVPQMRERPAPVSADKGKLSIL